MRKTIFLFLLTGCGLVGNADYGDTATGEDGTYPLATQTTESGSTNESDTDTDADSDADADADSDADSDTDSDTDTETGNDGETVECWSDADGDGYGFGTAIELDGDMCPDGFVENGDDCDDDDRDINPDVNEVDDLCDNGMDDDCDGDVDDEDSRCEMDDEFIECWSDADDDGYGRGASIDWPGDECPEGYADRDGDCDDTDDDVWRDCDDGDHEVTCYRDRDDDGYGDPDDRDVFDGACPDGWVLNNDDCDDDDRDVSPAEDELDCDDGVDDDCDGDVDEDDSECPDDPDLVVCFWDSDGDGYGDPDDPSERESCSGSWVRNDDDCDDRDDEIHPDADEECDDIDNDCDDDVDEDDVCDLEGEGDDDPEPVDDGFCPDRPGDYHELCIVGIAEGIEEWDLAILVDWACDEHWVDYDGRAFVDSPVLSEDGDSMCVGFYGDNIEINGASPDSPLWGGYGTGSCGDLDDLFETGDVCAIFAAEVDGEPVTETLGNNLFWSASA